MSLWPDQSSCATDPDTPTHRETNKINPSGDKVRDIKQTDGCWFANCESGSGDKKSRQLSQVVLFSPGGHWTGDKGGDDSCNSA